MLTFPLSNASLATSSCSFIVRRKTRRPTTPRNSLPNPCKWPNCHPKLPTVRPKEAQALAGKPLKSRNAVTPAAVQLVRSSSMPSCKRERASKKVTQSMAPKLDTLLATYRDVPMVTAHSALESAVLRCLNASNCCHEDCGHFVELPHTDAFFPRLGSNGILELFIVHCHLCQAKQAHIPSHSAQSTLVRPQ